MQYGTYARFVFTTLVNDKNHMIRNDDKTLEQDNISHLNGLDYCHLPLVVRRQRKSRKREGKKLHQKHTQDRHLPLLLNCRCGADDYCDNGQKVLTIFPKTFQFMLEDNKNRDHIARFLQMS